MGIPRKPQKVQAINERLRDLPADEPNEDSRRTPSLDEILGRKSKKEKP